MSQAKKQNLAGLNLTGLGVTGLVALGALAAPSSAEAKNIFPYNHPDLEWYTIETEHFAVHYPQSRREDSEHALSAEWTAKKTAKVAEEMFPRMCAEFNYYLKERVHIVILDQGDDLQGFTVPSWDWIEISANPGNDFYRQRGRMDWLPDVLVHEFAHVISLKAQAAMSEGSFGTLVGGLYSDGLSNSISGAEVLIGDTEPFFWTEGGAEFWSDNAGYNWWTPSRDMHIRTTVLQDRLLEFREWLTVQQGFDWGDGERGYQQGYSFALYLRQRFGADTYAKLGLRQAERWQGNWVNGIEDVTGVPAEQLYNDWVAYVTEKYNQQWDAVRAEGEVTGREMMGKPGDWEYTDPAGRDKWFSPRYKRKGVTGEELARMDRERTRDRSGQWTMVSQYSPDGKWFGANSRGVITLSQVPEGSWSAFSGAPSSDAGTGAKKAYTSAGIPAVFMSSWDFIPGQDAVVINGTEGYEHLFTKKGAIARHTGISFEADGYEWNELWYVPIPVGEEKDGNLKFNGVKQKPREGIEGAHAIPNTKRAMEPTVSPDGKRVAYLEYADGTLNLVTINIDGSDKKRLTDFHDGTWMQRADWSPDGKKLVVGIFRNFQQDLYIIDADGIKPDGSGLEAIMWDRWEDMDPHWAEDGKIYFSSDPNGIFNVYRYDPASKKVEQITNVIGGAEAPTVTPEGNLIFSYYTAFGWKLYGLSKGEFLLKDVTDQWNLAPSPAVVRASWEFREDLSAYKPVKYNNAIMAPSGLPILRVTNDSRDDISLQVGAQVFVSDYTEDHTVFVIGYLGSDMLIGGGYTYSGWYPTFNVFGYHGEFKFNGGYLLDDDNNTATKGDQAIYEIRNQQYVNFLTGDISYPWNGSFNTALFGSFIDFGFRSGSDDGFSRYGWSTEGGLRANFSNIGYQAARANPVGGRNVDLALSHGYADIVYEAYGGHVVDDGELLDNYHYNKAELRWTEQVAMPTWGWLPGFVRIAGERRHAIQLDVQGGYIDRNVSGNDEFRAGGQHPYYFGSDSLRPNTQFSGYPASALNGETMAILGLGYRFPIRRQLNRRVGPFYLYDLTGQIGGTAGNLWSYRPPAEEDQYYINGFGDRVAYNANNIRREIPFVDTAYKNGNYLLYDVAAELRVTATAFNNVGWNSFFRVAYGFNEIGGYGDVNGDDIQDTTDDGLISELSNEKEPAGFRFYVGLGTGW